MLRRALPLFHALAGCGGAGGAPPAFSVELGDLPALERALAERRGPCLLNFWATWCPPCVAELPDLVAVAKEFGPSGLRTLGVSYDLMVPGVERGQAVEKVRGFLVKRELALETLIYEAPDFEAIDARFQLPGAIPVTLAFDRDGKVVDRSEGETSRERFAEMARKALK
jgi:thiol-disulfide isomerase/thioredoxin